ncbi:hypothetical protein HDU76_010354, partial [Blyttiomyces sp. JEL0837]
MYKTQAEEILRSREVLMQREFTKRQVWESERRGWEMIHCKLEETKLKRQREVLERCWREEGYSGSKNKGGSNRIQWISTVLGMVGGINGGGGVSMSREGTSKSRYIINNSKMNTSAKDSQIPTLSKQGDRDAIWLLDSTESPISDPEMCFKIGDCLVRRGILQDSVSWLRKAADHGVVDAMALLAEIFMGVSFDYICSSEYLDHGLGFAWLVKASNYQRHVDTKITLWIAECYAHGVGVVCDLKKAVEWYQRCWVGGEVVVTKGFDEESVLDGVLARRRKVLVKGEGRNVKQEERWFCEAAFGMGVLMTTGEVAKPVVVPAVGLGDHAQDSDSTGKGHESDDVAVSMTTPPTTPVNSRPSIHESTLMTTTRKLATRSRCRMTSKISFIATPSGSMSLDVRIGMRWLERAAILNHIEAMLMLGELWLEGGAFGERDPMKAAEMFEKAVELGSLEAAYLLAKCYRDGDGVRRDDKQTAALFWKCLKH